MALPEHPLPPLTTDELLKSFDNERARQQRELFTRLFALPPTDVIVDKVLDK